MTGYLARTHNGHPFHQVPVPYRGAGVSALYPASRSSNRGADSKSFLWGCSGPPETAPLEWAGGCFPLRLLL